jgi:cardiolipin synthase A/B
MDQEFHEAVSNLVREVIPETLDRLESKLLSGQSTPDSIRSWALELPQKSQREALGTFAKAWQHHGGALDALSVRATVSSHRYTEERRTKAEICWSGPVESLQGFRRTHSAFTELMSSAKHSVFLLTFAIGEVESLRETLEASLDRGVQVRIVVEDFDVFAQESRQDKIQCFGSAVIEKAAIYVWPRHLRRSADGRIFGSMHVKCLLIDDEALLLTSANWSASAMQDNMELGVLMRDRELSVRVKNHFERLISAGTLVIYG